VLDAGHTCEDITRTLTSPHATLFNAGRAYHHLWARPTATTSARVTGRLNLRQSRHRAGGRQGHRSVSRPPTQVHLSAGAGRRRLAVSVHVRGRWQRRSGQKHDEKRLHSSPERGAPVGVLRFLLGGARTCDCWIFRLLILQFFGPGHGHVPELSSFALNKNCATVFDILVSQTCIVEQLLQKMDK
jgi:hypothetical protein